jgi:arylsulfatase A-like enzyme
VDGLRADHVGAYGYGKPTTPMLDALAKQGVVFERCYAASAWPLPAAASLLTGQFPCEHGALADGDTLAGGSRSLAQRLQSLGYATSLFSSNPFISQATQMERGFGAIQVRPAIGEKAFERWQRSSSQEPFFVYVHNARPHEPYTATNELIGQFGSVTLPERSEIQQILGAYRKLLRADFDANRPQGTTNTQGQQRGLVVELDNRRAAFTALYDACVREADEALGALIEDLRKDGLWERTLLIVTGSVGMEMGEHGGWLFDHSLYDAATRVPLIIRFPGDEHAGLRVAEAVSHLDVVPTVLERLEQPSDAGLRGVSLLPAIRGEKLPAPRVLSMRINERTYFRKFAKQRGHRNLALADGSWKGIWNVEGDTFELYDLAKDPKEDEDVSAQNADVVNRMRDIAKAQWAYCPPETTSAPAVRRAPPKVEGLPDDVRKALESLGYLDDDAAASQPADRPKPNRVGGDGTGERKKKKSRP